MPNKKDPPQGKVKYPLSVKLIAIIAALMLVSLGAITSLVSYTVSADVRITAEENNFTVNKYAAGDAENKIQTVRAGALQLLDTLEAAGSSAVLVRQAAAFFFERNQDIAAIIIPEERELVNTRFFIANEIDGDCWRIFLDARPDCVSRACAGETLLLNASPEFSSPVLALMLPWLESGKAEAVVILFSAESLSQTFGTGTNLSYMVNGEGELLAHSDVQQCIAGVTYGQKPAVQAMLQGAQDSYQSLYHEGDSSYFCAYTRVSGTGGAAVLTEIPYDLVFEGVAATTRRNVYLTCAVLFCGILLALIFARSISKPLRVLAESAEVIASGNFNIELKTRARDETGLLTRRFNDMTKGLAERERLKDTFGRFINKDIAEKAMRGELALGGETKNVTIFFSDIRSFTAISEKLEPFEVVEFLNDYMTRMVDCVNKTGGVVDKFIGDAVMAVWGAPVSAGSAQADALNCVRAALMMRAALVDFNKGRGGDKKPIIKIGCGINTGPVVAGQIGSTERMEYTVIGDAVNFASRTEALNKPFGTDILITENTWELLKDRLITEEMPGVKVKGKEKPARMFAVVNMLGADDIPGAGPAGHKTIQEVRALLGIPAPDLAKVNADAEEKKYSIQGA